MNYQTVEDQQGNVNVMKNDEVIAIVFVYPKHVRVAHDRRNILPTENRFYKHDRFESLEIALKFLKKNY